MVIRLNNTYEGVVKIFDELKMDDTETILDQEKRDAVYSYREELAITAFHSREWVKAGSRRGNTGLHVVDYEVKHCDNYSYVKINYRYDDTCGSDSKNYADIYKVDDVFRVSCIAGHESAGAIGGQDIFANLWSGGISDDGINVIKEYYTNLDKKRASLGRIYVNSWF